MTHPLEDENRRLKAALEGLLIEVDGPPPYDTQTRVAAARAALAAEPASGEAIDEMDRPTVCVGEYTIGELRQGKPVYTGAAILLPADDLTPAPPPPPAQGEEETAKNLMSQFDIDFRGQFFHERSDARRDFRNAIAAALRQRADEEREKVARWMIAHSYATGHGDTIEDLLAELAGEATRVERERIANNPLMTTISLAGLEAELRRAASENEACAQLLEEKAKEMDGSALLKAAAAIRARITPDKQP